ncbi:MAG: restriction endonuclease subunit S, partial [Rhabdochlamydiaceae bacterium]
SSRAPIGYLAISEVRCAINQGMIAINANKLISNYFMLNWCHYNLEAIENRANGTTFLEISKSNFKEMQVIVPSKNVMNRFNFVVGQMHHYIVMNERQSLTLITLRDVLLPKLISGQIRVKVSQEMESN